MCFIEKRGNSKLIPIPKRKIQTSAQAFASRLRPLSIFLPCSTRLGSTGLFFNPVGRQDRTVYTSKMAQQCLVFFFLATPLLFLVYNYEAYHLPVKKPFQNSRSNVRAFVSWPWFINLTDRSPFITSAHTILCRAVCFKDLASFDRDNEPVS